MIHDLGEQFIRQVALQRLVANGPLVLVLLNVEVNGFLASFFFELLNDEEFLFEEHLSGCELVFALFKFQLQLLGLLVQRLDLLLQVLVGFLFPFQRLLKLLNHETQLLKLNQIRINLSLDLHLFSLVANLLVIECNQTFNDKYEFHEHGLLLGEHLAESVVLLFKEELGVLEVCV